MLFFKAIDVCENFGVAKKIVHDGKPSAFLLAFNFQKLKKANIDLFKSFFESPGYPKNNEKLLQELQLLNTIVNNKEDFLYLVSIAVAPSFRKQHFATKLLDSLCKTYGYLNIISDISSDIFMKMCVKEGFKKIYNIDDCEIAVRKSEELSKLTFSPNVFLAVPKGCPVFSNLGIAFSGMIQGVSASADKFPTFSILQGNEMPVDVYAIPTNMLLEYQHAVRLNLFIERRANIGNQECLYYVFDPFFDGFGDSFSYKPILVESRSSPYCEDNLVVDVFTSIPMVYEEDSQYLLDSAEGSFNQSRVLEALNFRTEYESGIPVKEMGNRGFKDRIHRFSLGALEVQLVSEPDISFHFENENKTFIGNPILLNLTLAIDQNSNICVLHLTGFSYGKRITQYLDCVSRNQVQVIDKSKKGYSNLFVFLEERFGLRKAGIAKSFVTAFCRKDQIPNDLLSSVLFCETYYKKGEGLGTVVDSDIYQLINTNHGLSQYEYADVFMNSNIVFQTSPNLFSALETRIDMESVTLFYIELVLFEESSIKHADNDVSHILSKLQISSSKNLLREYGRILSDYARTIVFWDVQMNYPSSQKSIANIRKYFGIKTVLDKYKQNQEVFQKIYDVRSDYIDKIESSLLTSVGAIFTVISVIELITSKGSSITLGIATTIIIILLLLKNRYLNHVKKGNNKNHI